MAVEGPRQHQAQHVDRGFLVPAPTGCFEHPGGAVRQVAVIGLPHRLGRQVRMDVNRHVEVFGGRQQPVIARVVEEQAGGGAIDEGAEEAEFPHTAGEFGRARVRRRHRQRSEAGEAIGTAPDGSCEVIVEGAAQIDTLAAGDEGGTGTGVGEYLERDARLRHRLQPPLTEVGKELERVGTVGPRRAGAVPAAPDDLGIDASGEGRNGEMLFEGDDAHWAVLLSTVCALLHPRRAPATRPRPARERLGRPVPAVVTFRPGPGPGCHET
jgi:hypothetical protein